jgi:ribosomal protein S18 acetylase RimI-like enzyme
MGFACYSRALDNTSKYLLHKLYILPNQQGKKTGTALLDFIINEIKNTEKKSVIQVNVNRHNKSIGFYQRIGFEVEKSEDIDIGNGFQLNDYVMIKKLSL